MPKSKRKRGVRLEMTSLMDVMFLVLVFFIYCIFDMTVHKGVKVTLPETAGVDEKGERVVVTIAADDAMEVDGVKVSREECVGRVKARQGANGDLPVIIAADRKASLGAGIELLGNLKAAGVGKVSFQVKR